jgi:tetratricopeptide (TPR) repeat protein
LAKGRFGPADLSVLHYRRGNLHLVLDQLEKASGDFETALALNPNKADAYAGLADVHIGDHDLTLCRQYVEKALSLDPNNIDARRIQTLLDGTTEESHPDTDGRECPSYDAH